MASVSRFRIIVGVIAALAVLVGFYLINRSEADASRQETDDAYVQADLTVIVPQVQGLLTHVSVEDNQHVQVGAPLVKIDDRDLLIAVANAKARLASADATVSSLQGQLDRQKSDIGQAQATLAGASASLQLAKANRQRFANLASDGSGTIQAAQQAEAEWGVQHATRQKGEAALRSAEQQSQILRAELKKAEAAALASQAELAAAELALSRTRVTAPVRGVVAQRKARVGGYARVGEPLLTLVPLDSLYIEANYRETQLARVRKGQPVDIAVDALPGVRLKGHVESLGPASGVSFSPVAPHNATGNFTKIVQRLPVRIRLEPGQETANRLRVGMSVRPAIEVGNTPIEDRSPAQSLATSP